MEECMPRRKTAEKRDILPDSKYNSVIISQFVNKLMNKGKKSVAEKILYNALGLIEEKTGQSGIQVFKQAINNVKPSLEVKSRRVGGATYQVPVEIRPERRVALAIRWLIGYSRKRSEHPMDAKLAAEILQASKNEGASIKKREDTHKMAEANKAFAHYRW
jgi:small subunit ribosomal protein S7